MLTSQSVFRRGPAASKPGVVDASRALLRSGVRRSQRTPDAALQFYLSEIQRHPVLAPDEQVAVARAYLKNEDAALLEQLMQSNLRLVVKIAKEMRKGKDNLLDLIQEGNLGLMHAIRKFDPERGVRLSTYSAWWIRAYMLRYAMRTSRLVRLETSHVHRRIFFRLKREMQAMEARGERVDAERFAREMDVDVEHVEEMMTRFSSREVSADQPLSRHEETTSTLLDTLVARGPSAEEEVAESEHASLLVRKIEEFAGHLKGRDVVLLRHRLLADEPDTLRTLGVQLGVSRERVRQLEKQLMGKLESFLRRELPEDMLTTPG